MYTPKQCTYIYTQKHDTVPVLMNCLTPKPNVLFLCFSIFDNRIVRGMNHWHPFLDGAHPIRSSKLLCMSYCTMSPLIRNMVCHWCGVVL